MKTHAVVRSVSGLEFLTMDHVEPLVGLELVAVGHVPVVVVRHLRHGAHGTARYSASLIRTQNKTRRKYANDGSATKC